MTPQPQPRDIIKPRPWWLRWLRRLGVTFLVVAASVAILDGYHHYRVRSQLREATEALDRDDPGWRLEEIEAARAVVPEEENSARNVVAAHALLPKAWKDLKLGALMGQLDEVPPNERLPEPLRTALVEDLQKANAAVIEARKMVDRPRGRHAIVYKRNLVDTVLNDQSGVRTITRLLVHDSMQHNQAGNLKEALRSCRAAANAGRSIGDEPWRSPN